LAAFEASRFTRALHERPFIWETHGIHVGTGADHVKHGIDDLESLVERSIGLGFPSLTFIIHTPRLTRFRYSSERATNVKFIRGDASYFDYAHRMAEHGVLGSGEAVAGEGLRADPARGDELVQVAQDDLVGPAGPGRVLAVRDRTTSFRPPVPMSPPVAKAILQACASERIASSPGLSVISLSFRLISATSYSCGVLRARLAWYIFESAEERSRGSSQGSVSLQEAMPAENTMS